MTHSRPADLFWLTVRLSLGVVLFFGTGLMSAACIHFTLTPIDLWHRCLLGIFAALFALQVYAVWPILLFRRASPPRSFRHFLPPGGGSGSGPAIGALVPVPP